MIEFAIKKLAGKICRTDKNGLPIPFNPTSHDRKCINEIIRYFNNQNKSFEVEKLNVLSLYLISLRYYIIKFGNVQLASSRLHEEIDLGFDFIIENFVMELNQIEENNFMKKIGCHEPKEIVNVLTKEQTQYNLKLIQENTDDYFKFVSGYYKPEEVKEKIIVQAHQAVKNF